MDEGMNRAFKVICGIAAATLFITLMVLLFTGGKV